jgi:fructokinase
MNASTPVLFGAIEGGGTKFVCAIARSPLDLVERLTVPTRDARSTLEACAAFLVEAAGRHGALAAVGVGCFGPLDLRPDSPGYGRLLPTPKAGWTDVDLVGMLRGALEVPVLLDTDVGAAAFAEWKLGAGQGRRSLAYVTVGTGIGAAVVPRDDHVRLMHAEMGHLPVRRHPEDAQYRGVCPFHEDCLEGLASGPAILARWGMRLADMDEDHPGRRIIASYLGQLAASIALTSSVERLVFGGGVGADARLLPRIRQSAFDYLNGYFAPLRERAAMDDWIRAPALGDRSSIAGAVLMAQSTIRS